MYKIVVYAIAKNEEKFVRRWVESMSEADSIYVLDTGSSDNTVSLLKELGVNVKEQVISPWRFDVARNISLDMVPNDTDICICTDLDEVFEPGWRKKLEEIWKPSYTRLRYNYNWFLDENMNPLVNFYIEKIHSRDGYKWTHPVHEVLTYTGDKEEVFFTTDEITVNHFPDSNKSRSSYLSLLELSIEEDPDDDRNMHYLGREYMYYGRWNDCIDTLIKHLNLKSATWNDERAASMRFIARAYKALNRYEEAKMWLNKAIDEAPYLRDAYVEMSMLEYDFSNWEKVIYYCNKALEIKEHKKSYINETFSWDYTIYDLLSVAYFYYGDINKSLEYSNIAIEMNPNNDRILNNNKIIKNEIN